MIHLTSKFAETDDFPYILETLNVYSPVSETLPELIENENECSFSLNVEVYLMLSILRGLLFLRTSTLTGTLVFWIKTW